jgi:hypothetical protein
MGEELGRPIGTLAGLRTKVQVPMLIWEGRAISFTFGVRNERETNKSNMELRKDKS